MSQRKSKTNHKSITQDQKTYTVITQQRDPRAEDFLPDYHLRYEHQYHGEAEEMAQSLWQFLQANEELILAPYHCADLSAIQEGFARAVALSQLYLRSLYLE